jgi:hypothetical protein
MTNNKQQTDHIGDVNKMLTAVESIIQKINNVKPSDFCSIETIKQWCEQAKEIEKQQMKDAVLYALDEDGHTGNWKLSVAQNYYNEKHLGITGLSGGDK